MDDGLQLVLFEIGVPSGESETVGVRADDGCHCECKREQVY